MQVIAVDGSWSQVSLGERVLLLSHCLRPSQKIAVRIV